MEPEDTLLRIGGGSETGTPSVGGVPPGAEVAAAGTDVADTLDTAPEEAAVVGVGAGTVVLTGAGVVATTVVVVVTATAAAVTW
jgi:hypothetical protein